jgi:arylsulfatase A
LPEHKIDGQDIWPLIAGEPNAKSPQAAYWFYFANNQLQAIRSGKWKLVLPHTYRTLAGQPGGAGGIPTKYSQAKSGFELYDLEADWTESANVADQHPAVLERLQKFAEQAREELGDTLTQRQGSGLREPGRLAGGE